MKNKLFSNVSLMCLLFVALFSTTPAFSEMTDLNQVTAEQSDVFESLFNQDILSQAGVDIGVDFIINTEHDNDDQTLQLVRINHQEESQSVSKTIDHRYGHCYWQGYLKQNATEFNMKPLKGEFVDLKIRP